MKDHAKQSIIDKKNKKLNDKLQKGSTPLINTVRALDLL